MLTWLKLLTTKWSRKAKSCQSPDFVAARHSAIWFGSALTRRGNPRNRGPKRLGANARRPSHGEILGRGPCDPLKRFGTPAHLFLDQPVQNSSETHAGEGLKLLIVDDDPNHAEVVAESLERVGYECIIATSGAAGLKTIERDEPDVILTDLRMDGMDGLTILRKAKQELPDAEVVVITGHGDVQTAVEAMQAGAANYLQKPINLTELRTMVDKAAERLAARPHQSRIAKTARRKVRLRGRRRQQPRMHEIISKLKSIAPTAATVLIQGETGTGKELVAKAIHNNSPRKNKNFVAMNCTRPQRKPARGRAVRP